MAKIQDEGPESKGGVNEGPTTPRPGPPKGHAPEANDNGRAEPGQVEWPPPGVEWPPPGLETSGLRSCEAVEEKLYADGYIDHHADSPVCAPAPSEDEEDRAYLKEHPPEKGSYRPLDKVVAEIDEGEKWGKRLYVLFTKGSACLGQTWNALHPNDKRIWKKAALRFRAECVEGDLNLAEAAAGVLDCWDNKRATFGPYCIEPLRAAHSDLSNQCEAPKDKPRLSDEELGYSLQRWLLDEGLAEIALTAEEAGWFGAAIRARTEAKSP